MFSAKLFRALKADREAQANSGEIVGLDFDPFIGSQDPGDPGDRYEVRRVSRQGNRCSAEVWFSSRANKREISGSPEVVAELALENGKWRFVNFGYPSLNADLLSVLQALREDRRKQ
jgi:hypothetical protein